MNFADAAYNPLFGNVASFWQSKAEARNDVYERLVWVAQLRYLDAVENSTDREVRRRVLVCARLLNRWKRGF